MTDAEYKQYHSFFTDYWTWFKESKTIPETDSKGEKDFWKKFLADGTALYEHYGKSQFAKDMIFATIDELERGQEGKTLK